MIGRFGTKIVQAEEADGEGLEGGGQHGLSGICKMQFAVDRVAMERGVKCHSDLGCSAAECEPVSAAGDVIDSEALRFQPVADFRQVGGAEAELIGVLFGREPAAVVGGRRVLLFGEQLLQGGLLERGGPEGEGYEI